MKNIFTKKIFYAKILPFFVVFISLVFAGSVTSALSQKYQVNEMQNSTHIAAISPTITPQPTIAPAIPSKTVLGVNTYNALPTPTQIPSKSNTIAVHSARTQNKTTQTVSNVNIQNLPSPTAIPTITLSPTITLITTPTQTIQNINMQLITPDGTSNFSVVLKSGANACDVLQEAKDEGKINSVTFDDSYVSSLHSRYVTEINSYKDNWTFTVNGNSPLGCSLSNPKPNDVIVWKFG